MEEESLLLTQRDRDVLKVLHEVRRGHITQREGAEQLKRTTRWIRELVGRIEAKGDRGIIHGRRGQPSTHKIAEKIEKRAVTIIQREYGDFGPTLASEYLARDHQIAVSRETVRKWMRRAGLWKRRKQRIEQVHMWRPRRSCFGELVQWDTSDHDWLEGRGERIYLIGMIDDATSRAWGRFARQAKGRIERFFETAQDRLVKGMRKRNVCTLEAANGYLEKEYLPLWNERFTVRPASAADAHRPLGKQHDLASILSHVEKRVIGEDYTIRYDGRLYKLSREQVGPGLKKQSVRVEHRLDGRLMVPWRGEALELKVCEPAPPANPKTPARAKSGGGKKHKRDGNNGWMKSFPLHGGPSLEEVVAHAYGEAWEAESEQTW